MTPHTTAHTTAHTTHHTQHHSTPATVSGFQQAPSSWHPNPSPVDEPDEVSSAILDSCNRGEACRLKMQLCATLMTPPPASPLLPHCFKPLILLQQFLSFLSPVLLQRSQFGRQLCHSLLQLWIHLSSLPHHLPLHQCCRQLGPKIGALLLIHHSSEEKRGGEEGRKGGRRG